jgi:cytoskeletal protein CcmA (bactofilin family)
MAFNLSNNNQMQQNRESNKIDIIEKTTRIVGNITSQADFRIDGKVEGTITTTWKGGNWRRRDSSRQNFM